MSKLFVRFCDFFNSGRGKHCAKNVNGRHNNKSKTKKTFFLKLKKARKMVEIKVKTGAPTGI